ncbi:MAG: glycoside hydrolase family 2 TIM barrel-domain containing protein, partial [Candidatus Omnitrophota bacterium]
KIGKFEIGREYIEFEGKRYDVVTVTVNGVVVEHTGRDGKEVRFRIYDDSISGILRDSFGVEIGSDVYRFTRSGDTYIVTGEPISHVRTEEKTFGYVSDYFLFSKEVNKYYNEHYGMSDLWAEMVYTDDDSEDWYINLYPEAKTGSGYVPPIMVITAQTVTINAIESIDGKDTITGSRVWSRYGYSDKEDSSMLKSLDSIEDVFGINGAQKDLLRTYYSDLDNISLVETTNDLTEETVYQGFDGEHGLPIFEYSADFFAVYDVQRVNGQDRIMETTVWKRTANDRYTFLYHSESSYEKTSAMQKRLNAKYGLTQEMWDVYDEMTDGEDRVWVEFFTYSDNGKSLDYGNAQEVRVYLPGKGIATLTVKSTGEVSIRQAAIVDNKEIITGHRTWMIDHGAYTLTQIGWGIGWENLNEIPELKGTSYQHQLSSWYPNLEQVYTYQTLELRYGNTGEPVWIREGYDGVHSLPVVRISQSTADIGSSGAQVILRKVREIKGVSQAETHAFNINTGTSDPEEFANNMFTYFNPILGNGEVTAYKEVYLQDIPADYDTIKDYLQAWGTQMDKEGGLSSELLRTYFDKYLAGKQLQLYKRVDYPLGINTYKIVDEAGWIYLVASQGLPGKVYLREKPVLSVTAPQENVKKELNTTYYKDASGKNTAETYEQGNNVKIENDSILLNGKEFTIQGVTVSFTGINDEHEASQTSAEYFGDKAENIFTSLEQAEINTFRFYYPPTRDILDLAYKHHIYVIVGFPNYDDRYNPGPDMKSKTYLDYIEKNKNHPAIIAWEFGNEYNYHPDWFDYDMNIWYDAVEKAAIAVREIDSGHLISTTYGLNIRKDDEMRLHPDVAAKENYIFLEEHINRTADFIDITGLNSYNWDSVEVAGRRFEAIAREIDPVNPQHYYFSEVGADSFNNTAGREDETLQAQADALIWQSVKEDTRALGAAYMTLKDELFKSGNTHMYTPGGYSFNVAYDGFGNEAYFGMFDINGKNKSALQTFSRYEEYREKNSSVSGSEEVNYQDVREVLEKQQMKSSGRGDITKIHWFNWDGTDYWHSDSVDEATYKAIRTQAEAREESAAEYTPAPTNDDTNRSTVSIAEIPPFYEATAAMETSKAERTYTFFMDPQPSPDFLPSLGLAAYYMGDYSGIKTIEYRDLISNEPGYLRLPSLRKEVVTDNYNHPINYRYVETESIFGRTIMESTIKGDSIYYVKRFLDDNPYQPAEAVVLIWDAEKNQYWGVKSIVYNETLDIDSLQKELGLTDAQTRDVVSCALHILRGKDNYTESQIQSNLQEVLAGGKLRFVKADVRIGSQPVYQEFYLEGDSLGRAIVINRADTTFITEQFIAGSRAPKSGYFIDSETKTAFLKITNTDDADPEHGLGKDPDQNFYRVLYTNLISGEVWYRWHYPYHVWGGWAYEERGYFEPAGTDALGRQINNWVPVVHTDVQDWLYDSDSPKSTSSWFVLPGQEKVLIYRSLDKGQADPAEVSKMVSELAMRNINSSELGEQENKDLSKLRDAANPALLRKVQYNYSYGKQEDRYYYVGHPLKDAAIIDPVGYPTYIVNLNWSIDRYSPFYTTSLEIADNGMGIVSKASAEVVNGNRTTRKSEDITSENVEKEYQRLTGEDLSEGLNSYSSIFDVLADSLIEVKKDEYQLVYSRESNKFKYSDQVAIKTSKYFLTRDYFGNELITVTPYSGAKGEEKVSVNRLWANGSYVSTQSSQVPLGIVPESIMVGKDKSLLFSYTGMTSNGTVIYSVQGDPVLISDEHTLSGTKVRENVYYVGKMLRGYPEPFLTRPSEDVYFDQSTPYLKPLYTVYNDTRRVNWTDMELGSNYDNYYIFTAEVNETLASGRANVYQYTYDIDGEFKSEALIKDPTMPSIGSVMEFVNSSILNQLLSAVIVAALLLFLPLLGLLGKSRLSKTLKNISEGKKTINKNTVAENRISAAAINKDKFDENIVNNLNKIKKELSEKEISKLFEQQQIDFLGAIIDAAIVKINNIKNLPEEHTKVLERDRTLEELFREILKLVASDFYGKLHPANLDIAKRAFIVRSIVSLSYYIRLVDFDFNTYSNKLAGFGSEIRGFRQWLENSGIAESEQTSIIKFMEENPYLALLIFEIVFDEAERYHRGDAGAVRQYFEYKFISGIQNKESPEILIKNTRDGISGIIKIMKAIDGEAKSKSGNVDITKDKKLTFEDFRYIFANIDSIKKFFAAVGSINNSTGAQKSASIKEMLGINKPQIGRWFFRTVKDKPVSAFFITLWVPISLLVVLTAVSMVLPLLPAPIVTVTGGLQDYLLTAAGYSALGLGVAALLAWGLNKYNSTNNSGSKKEGLRVKENTPLSSVIFILYSVSSVGTSLFINYWMLKWEYSVFFEITKFGLTAILVYGVPMLILAGLFAVLTFFSIWYSFEALFAYYEGKKEGVGQIRSIEEAKKQFKALDARIEDLTRDSGDGHSAKKLRLSLWEKFIGILFQQGDIDDKAKKYLESWTDEEKNISIQGYFSEEAQERIARLVEGWFMDLPPALLWEIIAPTSVVATCFTEPIWMDIKEAQTTEENGIETKLNYFIRKYYKQWQNFVLQRDLPQEVTVELLTIHGQEKFSQRILQDKALVNDILEWANMRNWNVGRTIMGMAELRQSWELVAKMYFPKATGEEIKELVDRKLQLFVNYEGLWNTEDVKPEQRKALRELMRKYPFIEVWWGPSFEPDINTKYPGHSKYQASYKYNPDTKKIEIMSVTQKGEFYIPGKTGGQGLAFPSLWGVITFLTDANVGFRIEEGVRMPFSQTLLNEFSDYEEKTDYVLYGEQVFPQEFSVQSKMISLADETWTNIVQRFLGTTGACSFYGHSAWTYTNIIRSIDGTPHDYPSEDIVLGMRMWVNGYRTMHKEHCRFGKSRPTGWSENLRPYAKYPMGAVDLALGNVIREVLKNKNVPFSQKIMLIFTLSFYYRKPLVYAVQFIYLYWVVVLGVSGFISFPAALLFGVVGLVISQAITFQEWLLLVEKHGKIRGTLKWLWVMPANYVTFVPYILIYAIGDVIGLMGYAKFKVTAKGLNIGWTKALDTYEYLQPFFDKVDKALNEKKPESEKRPAKTKEAFIELINDFDTLRVQDQEKVMKVINDGKSTYHLPDDLLEGKMVWQSKVSIYGRWYLGSVIAFSVLAVAMLIAAPYPWFWFFWVPVVIVYLPLIWVIISDLLSGGKRNPPIWAKWIFRPVYQQIRREIWLYNPVEITPVKMMLIINFPLLVASIAGVIIWHSPQLVWSIPYILGPVTVLLVPFIFQPALGMKIYKGSWKVKGLFAAVEMGIGVTLYFIVASFGISFVPAVIVAFLLWGWVSGELIFKDLYQIFMQEFIINKLKQAKDDKDLKAVLLREYSLVDKAKFLLRGKSDTTKDSKEVARKKIEKWFGEIAVKARLPELAIKKAEFFNDSEFVNALREAINRQNKDIVLSFFWNSESFAEIKEAFLELHSWNETEAETEVFSFLENNFKAIASAKTKKWIRETVRQVYFKDAQFVKALRNSVTHKDNNIVIARFWDAAEFVEAREAYLDLNARNEMKAKEEVFNRLVSILNMIARGKISIWLNAVVKKGYLKDTQFVEVLRNSIARNDKEIVLGQFWNTAEFAEVKEAYLDLNGRDEAKAKEEIFKILVESLKADAKVETGEWSDRVVKKGYLKDTQFVEVLRNSIARNDKEIVLGQFWNTAEFAEVK